MPSGTVRLARSLRARSGPLLRGVGGVLILIAFLELAVATGMVDEAALPPVHDIILRMIDLAASPGFLREVWVTTQGAVLGVATALVVGTVVATVVVSSDWARRTLMPTVELVRPLPAVALAPLLLSLLGRGLQSRSLAVAFACTWPILFNAMYGLRSVDPVAKDTARSFQLGPVAALLRVSLPATAPFVFTGLRIATSIAIIVEISVEILLPDGTGVGGFIVLNSIGVIDRETVYGATLIAGVLGLVINWGLAAVESRLFAWQRGMSA